MKIEQLHWNRQRGWQAQPSQADAQLVLVFGATDRLDPERVAFLREAYPGAHLLGCSTSGERPSVTRSAVVGFK